MTMASKYPATRITAKKMLLCTTTKPDHIIASSWTSSCGTSCILVVMNMLNRYLPIVTKPEGTTCCTKRRIELLHEALPYLMILWEASGGVNGLR